MPKYDFSVLIVEDHPIHIAQLLKIISDYTVDIAMCPSAETALHIFESSLLNGKCFDILIVDMNLPGMNGKELIGKVRELEEKHVGSRIRIIAMSADPPKKHIMEACNLGAGCYIEKPVTDEKVANAIVSTGLLERTDNKKKQIQEIPEADELQVEKLFLSSQMREKLSKSKAADEDLFTAFIEEMEELLSALEVDLLELENDSENADLIGSIFRNIHTSKGNFGVVGLDGLGNFTHRLEDIFAKVRSGEFIVTPDLIDIVLKGKDFISRTLKGEESDEELDKMQVKVLCEIKKVDI